MGAQTNGLLFVFDASQHTFPIPNVNRKAMSMPHGTTSTVDQSEKWIHDARKQIFPNKVDWAVHAINGAHIWIETDASGCFVSQDCKKTGPRKKCTVCKVVAHQKCIEQLERIHQIKCKLTFREAAPKGGVETNPPHHIVRRRKLDGRCDSCGKAFQSMLSYKTQKDYIAVNCSWCKRAYHMKPECSNTFLSESQCDMGIHKNLILSPSWIVKLPPRKYSQINNRRGGRPSTRRHSSKERRAFVIKPIEDKLKIPLLVFVNPKSGGNQGARILEKYQYILNPRQVFDLSHGGPRFGLDLYRKVPNLRILVCGGDGTVGWILSEIDRLKINPPPAVAVLPLGTGNDLARFLGWGGGYTDEPLSKILSHIEEGEVQRLDRWDIDVQPNRNAPVETDPSDDNSVARLPLSVMNNYYSIGADADVCLEFHESREANPERFTSRLKNLYFYGKLGSESLMKRKNKDLYKCIHSLLCDGCELIEKIRELKPLCLIFLNISSYSAGTSPWGNPNSEEFLPQSCNDGYLEIIGLTSKSMLATQVGGHGIRIYQCQSAILTTNNKISMQVDGEPCRLNPSRIQIKQRNQSNMIAKKKPHHTSYHQSQEQLITPKSIRTKLFYLNFTQYDSLIKYDIDEIKAVVTEMCSLEVDPDWQLDDMRKKLQTMNITGDMFNSKLTEEWCFLDATWTVRIYRIDEAQESLLHVGDIMEGGIYVLDLQKGLDLTIPINNSLSKSQPNSPQLERSTVPLKMGDSAPRPARTLHSLSLDLSQLRNDDLAQCSSSDLSSTNSEDDINSLSSSPGLASPSTPMTPDDDIMFRLPEEPSERIRVFLEAAKKGLINKFRSIHESGISLTVCDSSGRTPLHLSARYGRKNIVEYILNKVPQCVIDLVDNEYGQTALHKAALYKKRTICRTLIGRGASVVRLDTEGNTPQLLALKSSDTELAKYLQNQERLQLIASDDHETAV
ncbi:diacylglycerol kinase zeta-like isoform X3 [Hydractinia symbiolongicarpus]|uniref:diacylglycerol kinase zeta-like isoform X3 n=1 Tax=Hydractinia symbiolongicarpus TaxID=13093 RepID=UPI00254E6C36|nr:diacylglycerol kinase zeta-like isoform X3 [Hydractinia symbiolongicarpus]